jgi:hypothetical protein
MLIETARREGCEISRRGGRFSELAAVFPLAPIKDDVAYSRAIAILDRLFLLNREKSRDESDYFRVLAQLAYEYECQSR